MNTKRRIRLRQHVLKTIEMEFLTILNQVLPMKFGTYFIVVTAHVFNFFSFPPSGLLYIRVISIHLLFIL